MSKKDVKPVHSEIGASSMERWQNCPGSVRLSRGIPNQSSVYAEEGTRAHELAADWLGGKLPPDDTDEETLAAVEVYVNHIESRWKSLPRHDKTKLMIEHKFDLSKVYPGLYGTADCVMYDGANKILYVDDYKHGKGIPVDPENNPQLMYYGLGALLSLTIPIEKVVLTIVQPRYSEDLKQAIKSTEIEPEDMLEFWADLYEYAKATDDPEAPVVIGDHCQFCRAKVVCPALKKEAELAVRQDFQPDNLALLDPEVVSDLLTKIDAVESWCKGVREFAYLEAKAGRVPPGYKLVAKRATRKWADIQTATKTLEMKINGAVMRDCMSDPELKSPAQVEKILGKEHKATVDELVVAISSGDTLVPESDRRESSSKTRANEMFTALN